MILWTIQRFNPKIKGWEDIGEVTTEVYSYAEAIRVAECTPDIQKKMVNYSCCAMVKEWEDTTKVTEDVRDRAMDYHKSAISDF